MRLLDKTYATEDEEADPASRIAALIEAELNKLKLDTYNAMCVVRVSVDLTDDERKFRV